MSDARNFWRAARRESEAAKREAFADMNEESRLFPRKATAYLPVTEQLLADARMNPNVCYPFFDHACFIHTFPSWDCDPAVARMHGAWRRFRSALYGGVMLPMLRHITHEIERALDVPVEQDED